MKLFIAILLASTLQAAHIHHEKVYQDHFCKEMNGVTEVVLPDKTRVDCVTYEEAIEVDFAEKWAESIGQSLYYATVMDKRPAILLILENEGDERFIERLNTAIWYLNIKVYTITPEQIPP